MFKEQEFPIPSLCAQFLLHLSWPCSESRLLTVLMNDTILSAFLEQNAWRPAKLMDRMSQDIDFILFFNLEKYVMGKW